MTDADVARVVSSAAARGRHITDYEAAVFLGAREILAKDPGNAAAQSVVEEFAAFLESGVELRSFARFLLPIAETDEEIAVRIARGDERPRAAQPC
jgi:hypothetical protein